MPSFTYLPSSIYHPVDQPLGDVLVALVITTIGGHSEPLSIVDCIRPRVERRPLIWILRCSSTADGRQHAVDSPDVASLTSAPPGTSQALNEFQQLLDGKRLGKEDGVNRDGGHASPANPVASTHENDRQARVPRMRMIEQRPPIEMGHH